jgi:hypothetical protein
MIINNSMSTKIVTFSFINNPNAFFTEYNTASTKEHCTHQGALYNDRHR